MTQKAKTFVEKRKIIEIIKNFPKLKIKTYAKLLCMSDKATYKAIWRLKKRKQIIFTGKNLKRGNIYLNTSLTKTNY